MSETKYVNPVKTIQPTSRVHKGGTDIRCPLCGACEKVHDFAWSKLMCGACGVEVEKYSWILPENICGKCGLLAVAHGECPEPGCGATYHRCLGHGGADGVKRSLQSHRTWKHR